MTRTDPGEAAGLAVVRVWVEPGSEGDATDQLRSRITTTGSADLGAEQTRTVAGLERMLTVVREFLTGLAAGTLPGTCEHEQAGNRACSHGDGVVTAR